MTSLRFVEIEPKDLIFPVVQSSRYSKCWLTLTNTSNHYVAFKSKTTHPKNHCFRPTMGAISPGSRFVIEVTRRDDRKSAKPTGLLKEKCLIQTIVANGGESFSEVTSQMFRDADVEQQKLRVFLLGADTSPQSSNCPEKIAILNVDFLNCWRSLFINVAKAVNDSQRKLYEAFGFGEDCSRVETENHQERICQPQSSEPQHQNHTDVGIMENEHKLASMPQHQNHTGVMENEHKIEQDLEIGIVCQDTKPKDLEIGIVCEDTKPKDIYMLSKLEEVASMLMKEYRRVLILVIVASFIIGFSAAMFLYGV